MLTKRQQSRMPATNIGLSQWGLTCIYDTFVVNQSAVLRLNFCANDPPLRQAENRYMPFIMIIKHDSI